MFFFHDKMKKLFFLVLFIKSMNLVSTLGKGHLAPMGDVTFWRVVEMVSKIHRTAFGKKWFWEEAARCHSLGAT